MLYDFVLCGRNANWYLILAYVYYRFDQYQTRDLLTGKFKLNFMFQLIFIWHLRSLWTPWPIVYHRYSLLFYENRQDMNSKVILNTNRKHIVTHTPPVAKNTATVLRDFTHNFLYFIIIGIRINNIFKYMWYIYHWVSETEIIMWKKTLVVRSVFCCIHTNNVAYLNSFIVW